MAHTFDPEVSLHYWLLWPTVCHGTPDFGRSVNPISTRETDLRLCPPNYYWHPWIFSPSDGPALEPAEACQPSQEKAGGNGKITSLHANHANWRFMIAFVVIFPLFLITWPSFWLFCSHFDKQGVSLKQNPFNFLGT